MEIACDLAYLVLFIGAVAILSLLGYQIGFMILFVIAAVVSLLCAKITPAQTVRAS